MVRPRGVRRYSRAVTPTPVDRRGARLRILSARSLESGALVVGAIAFALTAIVALVVFQLQPAPIAGRGSLGQFAAIAGAVVAVLAFILGRYVVRPSGRRLRVLDIVDIAALAFAHGVIALLTWTLFAVIMEHGFLDAVVFGLSVVVLASAAAAATAYIAFYSSTHMDLQLLAVVLAAFLVQGVLASMLTASDPHWWQENLSALGMNDDISSLAFNLTLIVAGIMVTTLARFATLGIPTSNPHGIRNVRLTIVLVGLFLGGVGVFPVDQFAVLHTGIASGMVVVFGVLVILLPRWIPGMPHAFIMLGWLFLAVTVSLGILFAVGYYTLTAVELVAGILVFVWIVLFIRAASALRQDSAPSPDGGLADSRPG